MTETAIILAGGFGTRLQSVISETPKPMAPINGKPFLDYLLRYLKHYGIRNVILSVGYLHEKITAHYKDHFEGLAISYALEKQPLGTGGGIRLCMEQCGSEQALALNGDSFFDIDLHAFYARHQTAGSHISLALRKIEDAARYGTILTDNKGHITSFREKSGLTAPGTINAGIYLLNKETFLHNTPTGAFSIEKDFFETKSMELGIMGFEQQGYFIDIGVPEDYSKAQHDFKGFKY
jgi:D-glycero-alpha-D-manno-heptose 1-phosphate guanylyltransferase